MVSLAIKSDLNKDIRLIVLGKNHARTALIVLAKFLRVHKPKRILVFNHQLAVLLVLLRALRVFESEVVARNISTLSQKKATETSFWHKYFVQGLTKLLYGKVDRVIAQSKGMADDLVVFYGVSENKITIIHNPIARSIENYTLVQQLEKKEYLLCVGRLESVKAFHYAIAAFAAVAPNYPELRLKIVGKGSLEGRLKEQALVLGVSDRVDFEGYQTDMIPYYLHAKATLLTSLYEGFPNVLVESIALGTPVVAFDCPSGPSEIVEDGVNGFLVGYKDESGLAIAIRTALNKKWSCAEVAQTAARFRSSEVLQRYCDVLSS